MLNTRFDPLSVDLEGWSEAMGYSLENQEYDEVLAELYEKYKGAGNMSPEVKLIFMIISSATMFTISKKITKLDSSNGFVNMIGNILGKSNQNQSEQMYQQQMYQQQQQQQQMYQQQMYQQQQQQMYQTQYAPQQKVYQEPNIPNAYDLQRSRNNTMTETTDDNMPSKLQGPSNNIIGNDKIDLDNILKTMNQRKQEKMVEDQSEVTDEIFKDIKMKTQKRGRGRPKKGLSFN
jgi:type II secretory pathway pseudopilin PulG